MMNITEKYTFTSSENQNVEEVIKLDRHLIDIENVMVESLEAFTKRGKDVRVIDYENEGKLNITKYYFPLG